MAYDSIQRIDNEYRERKGKNPLYSLRSFAHALGISPAQLSQILSRKRQLSQKHAHLISERLGLSPKEKVRFITHAPLQITSNIKSPELDFNHLSEEKFKLISEWLHFAILSLTLVKGAKEDARWISRKLGVTPAEVNRAIRRLRELEILHPSEFKQVGSPIKISSEVPSSAMQRHHNEFLDIAKNRLSSVPLDQREFQTITFPANPNHLKKLKSVIDDFLTEANSELEQGSLTEVYTLAVQLYPLTLSTKEKKK